MRWASVVVGAGLVGAAIFAPQLGLDSNQDWGRSRYLLLGVGVLIIASSWLGDVLRILGAATKSAECRGRKAVERLLEQSGVTNRYRRLAAAWDASGAAREVHRLLGAWKAKWASLVDRSPLLARWFGTRQARVSFAAWVAFGLVALSYVWFVSVGTWVRWPGPSAYQDLQAEAFVHGQTYLLVEPSAELLSLANPYDPAARSGLSYLWDASLYQGRYYLYWGPVPALMLVPIKAVAQVRVGDDFLVLVFSIGTLFWSTRLLTRLWRDRFPEVPGWVVVGSVLVVGWANPATWLLNSPWVYESAIVGGQFFLLMGLNALYPALLDGVARPIDLLWGGLAFSLAVGTRFSFVAPVGLVTLIVVLRLGLHPQSARRLVTSVTALLLPLVLGAGALAGYNLIRFGSPTEFGHSYQLTSLDLEEKGSATSLGNILPNLYNYLVNPMRRLSVFPYVKPRWGGTYMSVLRLPVPAGYYSRQITGLLWAAPFAFFSLAGISALWKRLARRPAALARTVETGLVGDGSGWIRAAFLGAALGGFAFVQLYVVASMRYQGDFMPPLMLASTVGFWRGLEDRRRAARPTTSFALAGLGLMIWTAAAGLLLGITSYHARFEKLNPDLFDSLTRFFTP